MKGWKVVAKNKAGIALLNETYAKPGRKDRMMSKVKKTRDDPLTYEVTFKSKQIAGLLGRMPEEMRKQVYESFVKHLGKPLSFVKRCVEVNLL